MKYYLIAGERSGDLHGSNLIKALKHADTEASFRAWGGDYMQDAGAELVVHYREMAVMGIWEVVRGLVKIKRFLDQCKADILHYQPDVVILIDFAGFNLRMARFAKALDFKVFYYISPKLWAWNQGRVKRIKKYVDRMFVILPFEKEFYHRHQVRVDYVGNPVVDAVRAFSPANDFYKKYAINPAFPLVAFLPGSRHQEVLRHLSFVAGLAKALPEIQFAISVVNNLPESLYSNARNLPNTTLVPEDNYNLFGPCPKRSGCFRDCNFGNCSFQRPPSSYLQYFCFHLPYCQIPD